MGGEAGALAQRSETSQYVYVVHQIVPTRNQTKEGCNFNAKSLRVSVSLKLFVMQTRETYISFFFKAFVSWSTLLRDIQIRIYITILKQLFIKVFTLEMA